jgi:plasmid stabilization system protein ParE
MKFKAHILRRAERDVEFILTWLNERSPQGAEAWLRRWNQTIQALESTADSHGLAPENEGQELEIRQV